MIDNFIDAKEIKGYGVSGAEVKDEPRPTPAFSYPHFLFWVAVNFYLHCKFFNKQQKHIQLFFKEDYFTEQQSNCLGVWVSTTRFSGY